MPTADVVEEHGWASGHVLPPVPRHPETQRLVVVSHRGCIVPMQSVLVAHSMQSPVVVLQMPRPPPPMQFMFVVHFGWHWWSAQHAGIAVPQSEFVAHA